MRRARAALIGIMGLVAIGAIALPAVGSLPVKARADGLPAAGIDVGPEGVAVTDSPFRYVTLRAGRDTVIARTAQQGGQVLFSRRIPGRFTIPGVAYDGSASGLSADEEILVLIRPRTRFPQRRTVMAIVDTPRLRTDVVKLRGDFSFDAISPDGRWAYLIHYLSPRNPVDYEVRAYDTQRQRLVPSPIVDPSEPEEQMGGIPLSRATSPDGRWAYTLYTGEEVFVHALDTAGRTAVCVDLPRRAGRRILGVAAAATGLSVRGNQLVVTANTEPVALIDTHTFDVTRPAAPAGAVSADGGDGGGVFPEILLAALAGGVALGLVLHHARGRRSGRPSVAAGSPE